MSNAFWDGFLKEALDPDSAMAGAGIAIGGVAAIRRALAGMSYARASKLIGKLQKKRISTKGLPFTIRNPELGLIFAPGTLKRRVAELEAAGHPGRMRDAAKHLED